jgi:hypothetical protein
MIAPSSKLPWFLGLTLVPLALLGAMAPAWTPAAWIGVAVVCAAAGLDAFLSSGRLNGISVRLPDVLRLVKDRQATFDFGVSRKGEQPQQVRLGLVAPPALNAQEEQRVTIPPAGENFSRKLDGPSGAAWQFPHHQRDGRDFVRRGSWAVRASKPMRSDVRVYPNLLSDRKTAASLLLPRSNAGAHVQRPIGKGREFESSASTSPAIRIATFTGARPPATGGRSQRSTRSSAPKRSTPCSTVRACPGAYSTASPRSRSI